MGVTKAMTRHLAIFTTPPSQLGYLLPETCISSSSWAPGMGEVHLVSRKETAEGRGVDIVLYIYTFMGVTKAMTSHLAIFGTCPEPSVTYFPRPTSPPPPPPLARGRFS